MLKGFFLSAISGLIRPGLDIKLCFIVKYFLMHRPGFEPGYSAWKADIIAARPSVHTGEVYMHLQSINIFGHSNIDNMTGASQVKEEIRGIAAKYGIEVVGWLKLGDGIAIPGDEMGLLKGVKWANGEVDVSNVKNPRDIMPSAKAMIILGKRLMDDRCDIYYRVSDSYMASVEMMLLDIASLRTVECLRKNGFQGEEYTSYYLKVWAVLAGLDRQVHDVRVKGVWPKAEA
jgi:hypothetical protein